MAPTFYLLDTDHASRLLDPEAPLWRRILAANDAEFAITLPSVSELTYMTEASEERAANHVRLSWLLLRLLVLPFDYLDAEQAGMLLAEVRRAGKSLSVRDAQIAAVALRHHAILLTTDPEFAAVTKVRRDNWLAE